MKCIICKKRPVIYKTRGLCLNCYQKEWRHGNIKRRDTLTVAVIEKQKSIAGLNFVRNFFSHKNWFYEAIIFKFNGTHYTPDFYDAERNVFIEIAGTRQDYHANKEKYDLFRQTFPSINFEIRQSNGSLLDETEGRKQWDVISCGQ